MQKTFELQHQVLSPFCVRQPFWLDKGQHAPLLLQVQEVGQQLGPHAVVPGKPPGPQQAIMPVPSGATVVPSVQVQFSGAQAEIDGLLQH
ncbi:MAG: hypothetical protein QM817_40605 [Archangium sp.]